MIGFEALLLVVRVVVRIVTAVSRRSRRGAARRSACVVCWRMLPYLGILVHIRIFVCVRDIHLLIYIVSLLFFLPLVISDVLTPLTRVSLPMPPDPHG